jgi:hypothetical protein
LPILMLGRDVFLCGALFAGLRSFSPLLTVRRSCFGRQLSEWIVTIRAGGHIPYPIRVALTAE